ncbi:MAG: VTC domain-containing protein [Bianqueaceae bacterium]
MKYQAVFTRYELKYLLTIEQKKQITDAMAPYMALDAFGRTTIRNIYFDTSSYRLVRHSIERPAYKEKLRIRSYDRAAPDSTVFVELKKKYRQVVTNAASPFRKRTPWGGCAESVTVRFLLRSPKKSIISSTITGGCTRRSFFPMKGKPSIPGTAPISALPLMITFCVGRRIFP